MDPIKKCLWCHLIGLLFCLTSSVLAKPPPPPPPVSPVATVASIVEVLEESRLEEEEAPSSCALRLPLDFAAVYRLSVDWIDIESTTIPPQCSVNFIMGLLTSGITDLPKEFLWVFLKNHITDVSLAMKNPLMREVLSSGENQRKISRLVSINQNCKRECNGSDLNAMFESFLAKSIILSERAYDGRNIGPVYSKIFTDFNFMKDAYTRVTDNQDWVANRTELIEKVSQRQKKRPDELRKSLREKSDIPLMIDYFLNVWAFKRQQVYVYLPSPGEAEILRPTTFINEQNRTYHGGIGKLRGHRIDRPDTLRRNFETAQSGLATHLTIPSLVFGPTDEKWNHSIDRYFFPEPLTPYLLHAKERQIPIASGISGTTNVALWSLFSLHTPLELKELRLFLLSFASSLTANGGHNLQEVLSSARIVSQAARAFVNSDSPPRPDLFNEEILRNLEKVTEHISIDGTETDALPNNTLLRGRVFGAYHPFLSEVERDYPDLAEARKVAEAETLEAYLRTEELEDCR